jgi:uncharacterized protein (DUF2235 family)
VGKNIVICSDGTSNTRRTRTHVWQFFNQLNKNPDNACFYDPGVGSFSLDVFGKAFGTGLSANILDCYDFLVSRYEPGDHVYCFGFSRGGYTVRSFANFVSLVGLVPRNERRRRVGKGHNQRRKKIQRLDAEKAYKVYRANSSSEFAVLRDRLERNVGLRRCPVHCIGVWDTVGAMGLPSSKSDRKAQTRHRYHRMDLAPDLRHAYQALALDEERQVFWPHVFRDVPSDGPKVEQVWFPGMHSDVGGGYREKELANNALRWMAAKMPKSLGLDVGSLPKGDARGLMHDSRVGGVGEKMKRRVRRPEPGSKIHQSVIDRLAGPIDAVNLSPTRESGGAYRPIALDWRPGKVVADGFKVDLASRRPYGIDEQYAIVDRAYKGRA